MSDGKNGSDVAISSGGNKENDSVSVGDGIPWKCNICSKENDGKTSNKCIVCGRPKQSAPLKMAGFMKLKVGSKAAREHEANRKKNPNGSGLFASASGRTGRAQRLDAAAMRATMGARSLPAGSGRNAARQRQRKKKKDARPLQSGVGGTIVVQW